MLKNPWVIIAALAVVLIGSSLVYSNYVSTQANDGVSFEAHVLGNPNADVTLVEYSDFQCPACAQFAPLVKQVLTEYGDDIRFEYKHFPLVSIHPHAVPAAKAAEAAGQQGEFFAMHDKLFENQTTWSNSSNPTSFFNSYAEELGLDMDLFKQHMKASLIKDKVDNEFAEARSAGLSGTPSFMLNGERMQFDSYEQFIGQIEAAIGVTEEAEEATSTGASVEFGI